MFFTGTLGGGGSERVISTLCNELVDRGNDVYLVTNKLKKFAYEVDDRINTIHLLPENFRKYSKIVRGPMLYKRIRSVVKQIKPDVVISFIFTLNTHVILATLGLKIPVVVSERSSFDVNHTIKAYIQRFYINKLATKTVVITNYDYIFLGNKLTNKVVIPNPIIYPIYEGKGVRNKSVLAGGGIDRWKIKGFDNLIKIWGRVSPKFPEWKLQIAGGGKDESFDFLLNLAKSNNVDQTVELLGFQKNLDKLMQEVSIFVLSSRHEGLPNILLEAMSQGAACIAFDCTTGPREIITDNKSGLLVENQNIEEMEKALIRMLSDESLRSKISKAGLKEAERFMPKVIVDKWEDLFKNLK